MPSIHLRKTACIISGWEQRRAYRDMIWRRILLQIFLPFLASMHFQMCLFCFFNFLFAVLSDKTSCNKNASLQLLTTYDVLCNFSVEKCIRMYLKILVYAFIFQCVNLLLYIWQWNFYEWSFNEWRVIQFNWNILNYIKLY